MKTIQLVAIGCIYVATVLYAAKEIFDASNGKWVALGVFVTTYLVLKLITDRQERDLQQDLERMTPEQRDAFIEEAKQKGLVNGKK